MKEIKQLIIILIAISLHACKTDKSKKNTEESDTQVKKSNVAQTIDTSYKKNIRLFDNFYYDMPTTAVLNLENYYRKKIKDYDQTRIELTYKGASFLFEKKLIYKNKLLKEIVLESFSQDDLDKIIKLFTEKYGNPKVANSSTSEDIDDVLIRGIIKIEDPLYDPSIHKEISTKEYLNDTISGFLPDFGSHGMLVSEKFKIVERDFYYYKLFKNITTDELVALKAKVIKKKYSYKKINLFKIYTWEEKNKLIKIQYLYKNKFIGSLNKKNSHYNSMLIFYKNLKDIVKENLPEVSNERKEIKKNETNTLNDI